MYAQHINYHDGHVLHCLDFVRIYVQCLGRTLTRESCFHVNTHRTNSCHNVVVHRRQYGIVLATGPLRIWWLSCVKTRGAISRDRSLFVRIRHPLPDRVCFDPSADSGRYSSTLRRMCSIAIVATNRFSSVPDVR
jgi:hypothetical protein